MGSNPLCPFLISNKMRIDNITDEFSGMIGWRDPQDILEPDVSESTSGLYFQDMHPILTLDNIISIAPQFDELDLRSELSEWLRQKTNSSIVKAVDTVIREKIGDKTAKNLITNKTLYDFSSYKPVSLLKNDSIVGLEFQTSKSKGVCIKIEKLGINLTESQELDIHLFNTSQKNPIKTFKIQSSENQFGDLNKVENLYIPNDGNTWFLCYDQNQLEGKAIDSINPNFNLSKYFDIRPFKVNEVDRTAVPDSTFHKSEDFAFNFFANKGTPDLSGLNFEYTVFCDLTQILLDQKESLKKLVAYQVAIDIIREFAFNPSFRIGRSQKNMNRMELLYELDGDSQGYKKSGLVYEYSKTLESVKVDISNLSKACFPCKKKGLKFKTI